MLILFPIEIPAYNHMVGLVDVYNDEFDGMVL